MFDRLKGKGKGGPSDAPPGYEQAVGNPRFEKGDLVLVSSDRIKFNVPSEKLYAASSNFRELASSDKQSNEYGGRTITFTDAATENAHIIRLFLTLISDGTVDTSELAQAQKLDTSLCYPNVDDVILASVPLAQFLINYRATAALSSLKSWAARLMISNGGEESTGGVLLGAVADDPELVAVALDVRQQDGTRWRWDYPLDEAQDRSLLAGPSQPVCGRALVDPASWSWRVNQLMPADYAWAVSRAWCNVGDSPQLADRFRIAFRAARAASGKPPPSTQYAAPAGPPPGKGKN
ncbi:uncharacterized protein LOC62_06G007939 [Vanrija pseudolonga]|uniref:BTB domain-containing protein n=1 Tax=Vanrija pseudolonga TaxID=143232 RepID=A0AAF1BNI4_9TREE|nr:hypothetical protein LOC62_06G007939 [Vanrija pseudolonga]